MKFAGTKKAVAFACAVFASGCATAPNGQPQSLGDTLKNTFASDDPCSDKSRNVGLLVGALAGAALGHTIGDGKKESTLVGAGVGALLGGLIGSDVDRRRCELAKVAKAHNLDILMTDITLVAPVATTPSSSTASVSTAASSLQIAGVAPADQAKKPPAVGMSFTVFDHGDQFAVGAATPSANALKAFADVAQKYNVKATGSEANAMQAARERNKKMRILLIGHTDDTGSSQLNADLSEARAQSIARIFSQQGFESSQIFYQGAGEVFPIADNRTEEGRARNRRVEIVDLSDDMAFNAFLASRRPNVAHYRPAAPVEVPTALATSTPAAKSNPPLGGVPKPQTTPPSKGKKDTTDIAATTPSINGGKTTGRKNAPSEPTPSPVPIPLAIAAPLSNLDFGGKPVNGQYKVADIGKPAHKNGFSIISSAYAADEAPMGSCATDRARISNRVKALESGQSLKTSAYLPGTASASWAGKINGHLVGLTGVAVLRDGGQPTSRPTLLIWKNWVDGSNAKPDLKTTGDVNTYQGDKALLYRVFPAEGPVRCIDMLIPNSAPNTAPASVVVYDYAKTAYQADYSPTIAR